MSFVLAQGWVVAIVASKVPVRMVFIEKRKDRVKHLDKLVERVFPKDKRPRSHHVVIHEGECQRLLIPALDQVKAWEAPLFVNLDGWGTDTPYSLVHQLGRANRPEVLITFSRGWSIRNRTREDDPNQLDRFYGEPNVWRKLADTGTVSESRTALLDYYMGRLRVAGFPYSLSFELVDATGNELLLVYATRSEQGVRQMKRAMWKVDPGHGQQFRDPRDVNQLTFAISDEPDRTLLRRQLLEQVVEQGIVSLADLKNHTLLETLYEEPQATKAINELEDEMMVNVDRRRGHENTSVTPSIFIA